tara:strand:+ start:17500 stop:17700 length:201 start_codon:yes stop_codon:yes gene_type:complete
MLKPGEKRGRMMLPASYSKAQLKEYRWCSERQAFLGKVNGPWGSRLNDNRWQDQGNRSRAYKETDL